VVVLYAVSGDKGSLKKTRSVEKKVRERKKQNTLSDAEGPKSQKTVF